MDAPSGIESRRSPVGLQPPRDRLGTPPPFPFRNLARRLLPGRVRTASVPGHEDAGFGPAYSPPVVISPRTGITRWSFLDLSVRRSAGRTDRIAPSLRVTQATKVSTKRMVGCSAHSLTMPFGLHADPVGHGFFQGVRHRTEDHPLPLSFSDHTDQHVGSAPGDIPEPSARHALDRVQFDDANRSLCNRWAVDAALRWKVVSPQPEITPLAYRHVDGHLRSCPACFRSSYPMVLHKASGGRCRQDRTRTTPGPTDPCGNGAYPWIGVPTERGLTCALASALGERSKLPSSALIWSGPKGGHAIRRLASRKPTCAPISPLPMGVSQTKTAARRLRATDPACLRAVGSGGGHNRRPRSAAPHFSTSVRALPLFPTGRRVLTSRGTCAIGPVPRKNVSPLYFLPAGVVPWSNASVSGVPATRGLFGPLRYPAGHLSGLAPQEPQEGVFRRGSLRSSAQRYPRPPADRCRRRSTRALQTTRADGACLIETRRRMQRCRRLRRQPSASLLPAPLQ